jgi:hypothetical protein
MVRGEPKCGEYPGAVQVVTTRQDHITGGIEKLLSWENCKEN